MGLIGRLELTVPDLLQILSLSGKTGRLRISRLGAYGEIGFKDGKVIFANSNSTRHTLGQILVNKEHITEEALMAALEQQHLSGDNKRLGAILIEKGHITAPVLQDAIRLQIEQVISEFLLWEIGFFRFDTSEIVADDEIAVDAHEFLIKSGISPDQLLLEGLRRMDEHRKAVGQIPPIPDVAPPATSDRELAGRIEKTPAAKKRTPPAPKPTPVATPDRLPTGWLEKAREAGKGTASTPKPTQPPGTDGPPPDWLEDVHEATKGTASTPEATPPFGTAGPPPDWLEDAHEAATGSPPHAAAPPPAASRPEKAPEPTKSSPGMTKPTPPPSPAGPRIDWPEDVQENEKVTPSRAAASPPAPSRFEKAPEPAKSGPGPTRPTPPPPDDGPRIDWPEEEHEAEKVTPSRASAPPPAPGRPEKGPEPAKSSPAAAKATPPPVSPPVPAENLTGRIRADHGKEPVPPRGVTPEPQPEAPRQEMTSSSILGEILNDSPIAPWVPIMHSAPDFVARGVVLFEQEGRLNGYDQFGVYAGIEGGNMRVQNIHIPLSEGSIFAGVFNRGKTYRGKMGPGKWNEYFLDQIEGNKPREAVLIPLVVAGKVIGVFYGDDAGTDEPLGDVEQLEALITQTFSAIVLPSAERQSKNPV